ncbi:type VI secretion system baseplate subunit TssG [Pseudorhodoferax soli]|uniref:Type VI secretion system protein ImpH n=1 Tax=Pseudorhodoferax soli TaxID=545864 RepID=A0A368Y6L6_9BURK|nr:type VI secretion system baseplate subunit TssG [Pseudorhodoferax soli]RCW75735.1 type VI secretion system protein ImpH [Pseudorhodoferax soli]
MNAQREALFAAVRAEPWAHDFFALLRRLEALHPGQPRIGRALRPSQEPVRLGQEAELDFAPAPLASFAQEKDMPAPRLGVRFFGLLGPHGPMPLHLTEYVRERQRWRSDPTAARFLDIFHHRMLALFYRAWADTQPTVQQDRPAQDRFAAWLGAGFGHAGTAPLQGALPRQAQLFQAGLLATRSRHPEGLAKLLAQHFRVPVRIEEHIAHWLPIAPEDRSRLGHASNRPQRSALPAAQLGHSANAGRAVRDRQFKFRVVLGPLTLAQYLGFLPGGRAWPALRDWIRQYAGLDLQWDVQLVLAHAELPPPRLGRRATQGPPLGVAAWLGRQQRDRGDLRLQPTASFVHRHGDHHA